MQNRIMLYATAALFFAFVAPLTAAAQSHQRMVDWCIGKNNPTPDQMLRGCTAAISSKKFKGEILGTIYLNRSLAYINKQQFGPAETELEQAFKLAPRVALVHVARSRLYGSTGRLDEAIEAAGVAIALNPKATLGYFNRASMFAGRGDHEKAIADFDKAIALDRNYWPAYANRAVAKLHLQRGDEALADATAAITLVKPSASKANEAMVLGNRAVIYSKLKKYDQALADMSRAIELTPTPTYLRARSAMYELAQKAELGLPDVEKLLAMDANDANAWSARCSIHAIIGKLDRAIADCNKSIELLPDQSNAFDNRALAYFKSGKYSEAIADYNTALKNAGYEQGGKVVEAFAGHLYGRGLAREKSGDTLGGAVDLAQAKAANAELSERFAYYLKQ